MTEILNIRNKSSLRAAHLAGCLVPLQQEHHRRGELQQPSDEHHQDTHCLHRHRGQRGLCGDQTNVQVYPTDENYKGEVVDSNISVTVMSVCRFLLIDFLVVPSYSSTETWLPL